MERSWNYNEYNCTLFIYWLSAAYSRFQDHPYYSMLQQGLVSKNPAKTASEYGMLKSEVSLMGDDEVFQSTEGLSVKGSVLTLLNSTETSVRTLVLDTYHWFFVSGVRVHNKGTSSGGSSYRSSYSSSGYTGGSTYMVYYTVRPNS
jgi:hypothetical protein